MINDLQIVHLGTLIAIAEEDSFEAAAHRIGRTQSAVTQQMKKLEEAIGTPVFKRNGRKRELTQAGQTLLRYGREIVSMSSHAMAAMSQDTEGGLLRIGVPHEVADQILPPALAGFQEKWPAIRVVVSVERSPVLMSMLQENRLELAVTTRRSSVFTGSIVRSAQSVWIAAEDFIWDPAMPLPLVLTDEPSMFRRLALSALEISGIPYQERLTSPSLAGIRSAIFAGYGVTVRTESSFMSNVRLLDQRDGLPPLPKVNYYGYLGTLDAPQFAKDFLALLIQKETRIGAT